MRRRAIAGMEDDFDDFDFDSESEEEKQDDGKRPVHDLAQIISDEASEINILDLVIKQLQQAVLKALMPPEPRDEVGIRIFRALRCRSWQTSVLARVTPLPRHNAASLDCFLPMASPLGIHPNTMNPGDDERLYRPPPRDGGRQRRRGFAIWSNGRRHIGVVPTGHQKQALPAIAQRCALHHLLLRDRPPPR